MPICDALPYARLLSGHAVPDDDRARQVYRLIDAEATRRGAAYVARAAGLDELRQRRMSEEITARCCFLLDALERDPLGRLAALPDLYADASRAGDLTPLWLDCYDALLRAWLARQPVLVAA